MGAFIRSKNVLLAELSEGAFIRRGALIRRNTVYCMVHQCVKPAHAVTCIKKKSLFSCSVMDNSYELYLF